MNDLLRMLAAMPGGPDLIDWFASLAAMSSGRLTLEFGRLFLLFVGGWEFVRYSYRWIFRRRSRIEEELEALEYRVKERNDTIAKLRAERDQLTAELKSARSELPGAAIARAELELRDFNTDLAIGHLETWFAGNAESIAAIAKRLARHHIAAAVPNPANHLTRAHDMLRLARGAAPHDQEAREISSELDVINASLQAGLLRDGDTQIGWSSAMASGGAGQGEALMPLVITLRDIAGWCFDRGMWRLTPIFADRAADLAQQGGRPLRRVWCQIEGRAAFYQMIVGHSDQALVRIDHVLTQAREFLASRDTAILDAQTYRAQVLDRLGRYAEALAEIDAFAPIRVEVLGERHPHTLTTRYLRAQVLSNLGRYAEALAEIDAFAPIFAEVQGERHPDTLTTRSLRIGIEIAGQQNIDREAELRQIISDLAKATGTTARNTLSARYRLARLLFQQGQSAAAHTEIVGVVASFDPATTPGHDLLRSATLLRDMIEGHPVTGTLIV